MYQRGVDIALRGDLRAKLFHFILVSFGMLCLCYILILGNMVFNIIERRSLEREGLALGSEVGNLELTYLSAASKIDLEFSKSLGFQETKPAFATRKSLGLAGGLDDEI